ncbi:hypothetical protein GVAV_001447 [Gurleya vavrai]
MNKNIVQKNETLILYKSRTKSFLLHPKDINKQLNIKHTDLIGHSYNTLYKQCYILRPYPSLFTDCVKRQTQILFEADISLIIFYLNIKKDDKVIESGTGSGVLTKFLSQHVGENGKIYSFERNTERYNNLINKFESNVILKNEDIRSTRFDNDLKIDAVFLDLPEPWTVIEKCYKVMIESGKICVFVPNVEQVLLVKTELKKYFKEIIMFENIKQEYMHFVNEIKGTVLRNGHYSHTGFLIFGQK